MSIWPVGQVESAVCVAAALHSASSPEALLGWVAVIAVVIDVVSVIVLVCALVSAVSW